MTDKNEKLKPPARRTGRTLGGGTKKAAPLPPPPTAELTPEQYAAEQAHTQATAQASGDTLPADSAVERTPVRADAVPGVAAASIGLGTAHTAVADPPNGAAQEAVWGQSSQATGTPSDPGPVTVEASVTPAHEDGEQPAVQGSPAAEVPGARPAAEVAVRPATSPAATGTAFPVQGAELTPGHSYGTRSSEAPSEGAPWAKGPGRPGDIPDVAVLLNQRVIARESLDSSVPAALKLKRRIKRFALDNELDHLPIGDIVAVAMDEWLTTRGF
ncbi:hypothetical protein ABZ642_25515 [Streptomyces sp. NPDC007157]|uniref:hypothetical protein n=1 Tax=Streptomyces sp. NPDC007157 TaxID=3154681 RepID=UPI0033FC2523